MASTKPPAPGSLKRLQFVQDGATYVLGYTATAERLYKSARGLVPTSLEPTLAKVEDIAVAATAPVVAKAQDVSAVVLKSADEKVSGRRWPARENCGKRRTDSEEK